MILFNQWGKRAVPVMSLLLVFTFTLTTNVLFNPATAWAEASELSEESQDPSSGAADSEGGFFSGIWNWVTSVTDAVNEMWGMENGSGVAIVVNGIFYLLLFVGVLFFGKMIFNIVNETINRKVDEKFEKPSFRKK